MRATASRSRARRSPASRYNENWRDPGEKYDIAIPWRPSTKSHQQVFIFFIFKRKRRRIRRARSEFFRPNFFTLTLSVSLGTLTMSIRVACLNALMSSLLSLDYLILSSFFSPLHLSLTLQSHFVKGWTEKRWVPLVSAGVGCRKQYHLSCRSIWPYLSIYLSP